MTISKRPAGCHILASRIPWQRRARKNKAARTVAERYAARRRPVGTSCLERQQRPPVRRAGHPAFPRRPRQSSSSPARVHRMPCYAPHRATRTRTTGQRIAAGTCAGTRRVKSLFVTNGLWRRSELVEGEPARRKAGMPGPSAQRSDRNACSVAHGRPCRTTGISAIDGNARAWSLVTGAAPSPAGQPLPYGGTFPVLISYGSYSS